MKRGTSRIACVALSLVTLSCFPTAGFGGREGGREDDLKFRSDRQAWMSSDGSPLALAGLFWLVPGENRFGTDPANTIILPVGTASARIGRFVLNKEQVRLLVDDPAERVFLGNQEIRDCLVKADSAGRADVFRLGDLRMKVIERGGRFAVRLINTRNPALLSFSHLDFFAIDPSYRIEARFIPYQPHKKISVTSVIGQIEEADCPGVVRFTLQGRDLVLEPILETPDSQELFFIFKDMTNGQETYEAGRFLYSDLPKGNRLILNFNQAHNPYCAYSPYSTCPLPPKQNWLKVAVRAGEKKYPHP